MDIRYILTFRPDLKMCSVSACSTENFGNTVITAPTHISLILELLTRELSQAYAEWRKRASIVCPSLIMWSVC